MTRVTYIGPEASIKILQNLMEYFGENGMGIVLPDVGVSRIYGKPDGRVKLTRTHEERCTVQTSDEAASNQTWEIHLGLFTETIWGSETAMIALAEAMESITEDDLPDDTGKTKVFKSPGGKIKLTRKTGFSLGIAMAK